MNSRSVDGALRPLYIVTERFGPGVPGNGWPGFLKWSGLVQMTEVVSLDSLLCGPIVREVLDADWPHIVNEDFMLNYFVDVDYLVERVGHLRDRNLLCVYLNPQFHPGPPPVMNHQFVFEGYDLMETGGGPSALTNCGGFPAAFSGAELSPHGLLSSFDRANEVRRALRQHYPDEPHASCDLWCIYRADAIERGESYSPG
jgi:hypothetical protein